MPPFLNEMRAFLSPAQILDSDLLLDIYSRDASYFNIKPLAVARPDTPEQVARLLALASRHGIGITFRTGGTSLSGQSVNNGIICELRTAWKRARVSDSGKKIWFEPGLTASQVNAILRPHHHHIGPDPASSQAAMMGGILANNSSGMQAGVSHNSYHTLSSMQFMLANGHCYDSASSNDRRRFEEQERELCNGLMELRQRILASPEIYDKIVTKYKIKNVTGYGMNSFVDFDNPMDIFTHLLIGSEGTLGFISSAELNTLPSFSVYSSSLLYFKDVTSAAAAAPWLGQSGALAVEMMDYASLVSYMGKSSDMPEGTTAMLIDYGGSSSEELASMISDITPGITRLRGITHQDPFTTTVAQRQQLWQMRDGIFPCVAGARVPGATVILEDVCAPVESLDRLVDGIQALFKRHGYQGSIFGHARDGNVHPLLTSSIDQESNLRNFSAFMAGFVDHVLSLNGSLKGEHGTGRAIAPFVAREWGDEIYSMMKTVKQLADPQGILNPGVIINDDPECFIKPMKSLDIFGKDLGYDRADKCIECGYCEHVCPSRDITLTPRQRLQARRVIAHMASQPDEATRLERQYRFDGMDSCCSDASCQMPCPLGISTAVVTDALRAKSNGALFKGALTAGARHFEGVQTAIRGMLKGAVLAEKAISPYPLIWATDLMHKLYSQVPHWSKFFPMPSSLHFHEEPAPDFIYFPACVTRIFGASSIGKDDLITVILRIASRAGIKVSLPRNVNSLCCSQIWEHKGDEEGRKITANKAIEQFWTLSQEGKIPIFCDTTSCTHTLLTSVHNILTPENQEHYSRLTIIDIVDWLGMHALPRLKVTHKKGRVLLHPTCASRLLHLDSAMASLATQCADEVVTPRDSFCCGGAGDRGFLFPKVAASATHYERDETAGLHFDGCYSLARTCEISMMATIGRPYESIAYLIDETTSE
ncbi:MAG: FAD-binding oxidoreductase [Pseudoflavonifractor sp.]|nr:FAD-binding oxidoreductase [Alloprevotella sp.]MCM1116348.1 FAD-binding oxidoreductase [Pseudoflavonifractor sp.]